MLSYLVNFIHAFIPVSLTAGMLMAIWRPVHGRKALRSLIAGLACGLLAGAVVYLVSRLPCA